MTAALKNSEDVVFHIIGENQANFHDKEQDNNICNEGGNHLDKETP